MTPPVAGERPKCRCGHPYDHLDCRCKPVGDMDVDASACPLHKPAPGAGKEHCGCFIRVIDHGSGMTDEVLDDSSCKYAPPAAAPQGTCACDPKNPIGPIVYSGCPVHGQKTVTPESGVSCIRFHRTIGADGDRTQWKQCRGDENHGDPRTQVDFFVPLDDHQRIAATVQASIDAAVRADRKAICDWIMSGDVKGDVCDNFKIVEGIRARSRDGEGE